MQKYTCMHILWLYVVLWWEVLHITLFNQRNGGHIFSFPKWANWILAYYRARMAAEVCWTPEPGWYPRKWRKHTCFLLWGLTKLIWYVKITSHHIACGRQLLCEASWCQRSPVPLVLFEAVAFSKIWKLFILLPYSNFFFLSERNTSNCTNINTVSAYSKATLLPEP